MKGLGKAAIVLTILFFVFLIPAGILIALGAAQVNNDYDVQGALNDVVDSIGEYSVINYDFGDSNSIGFKATYTPEGDIKLIELDKAAYSVEIKRSGNDEFVIEHEGNYPYKLVSEYDITDGAEYEISGSVNNGDTPFFFDEHGGVLSFGLVTDYNEEDIVITPKGKSCGHVTVYLPASYKGDFTINGSAADVDLYFLELGTLTLTEAAGDFDAQDCSVDKFVIKSVAGDIDYLGSAGSLDISEGMGDYSFILTTPLTGASRVKGCLGNIEIKLPVSSKVNVTTSGTLGNVDVDNSLVDGTGVEFNISGCLGNFSLEADD